MFVCVCEHANEVGGEPAPHWAGRWEAGECGCGDKYTLCRFPGIDYVAPLETSSIWRSLVLEPNVFLAPGVK